ncbi:MAG: PhnA domain protein [Deltaproteobacteria bacterium]|nr:PhnA domain protein [Deltaproteobacteria bacterium]
MIKELLENRSGNQCELCGSANDLVVHDLRPNLPASLASTVLVCGTCADAIATPESNPNHWHCLRESIWSEHDAVKALAYRILKSLGANPLADDLLGQIYLDPEVEAWASVAASQVQGDDAGLKVVDSNGTVLTEGDTVTLIKDLEVKGANFTAKRGTVVKNITLTDDAKYVEGKVNGIRIVLVAAYLKKA